jgi:hypothetical protein
MAKREHAGESRELESRDFENRDYEGESPFSMDWKSPLEVTPPPGFRYAWAKEYEGGQRCETSLLEAKKKMWTPVPGSRHPEYAMKNIFSKDEAVGDYCRYGGMMLFERAERYCRQEDEKMAQFNHQKLTSMMASENYSSDPSLPVRSDNQIKTGRTVTF